MFFFLPNNSDEVILVMITEGEKWYYLAVKSFSRLVHGIISKHNNDHYGMNCLHSFRTKIKLESHESVSKNIIIL